ncbi:hypothetical protein [Sphingobacterium sp. MYb382]|uniref:hypothetical protein n=1 Tax=Sphingobacterium sp. MYb382 TaxID=2745278 RepID=UPI0030A9EC31
MKNINTKSIIKWGVGIACSSLFFLSCQKTNYEQLKRPYTDVLSFKIASEYKGIDSLNAVISGDSISIYWDPATPLPASITPHIQVAAGATVLPASGQSVPFNNKTVFTVTAENGTTKTYRLAPQTNHPVPVIYRKANIGPMVNWGYALLDSYYTLRAPNPTGLYFFVGNDPTAANVDMQYSISGKVVSMPLSTFVTPQKFTVEGEYFLTGQGDKKDFRMFIKRLKDGFEVESEIETLTENKIVSAFPKFTSVQDTGIHQMILKMNGYTVEGDKVNIGPPAPSYLKGDFKFPSLKTPLRVGDDVLLSFENIRDDYDGKIASYYKLKDLVRVEYVFHTSGSSSMSFLNVAAKDLTINGSEVKHKATAPLLNSPHPLMAVNFVFYIKGTTVAKKAFPMPAGTFFLKAN